MTASQTPQTNRWAWASFVAGLAGFILALTALVPFIFGLAWLAWPLGLIAIASGWIGRRRARGVEDRANGRRAAWGIAFGCLGWVVDAVAFVAIVGVLLALLIAAATAYFSRPR